MRRDGTFYVVDPAALTQDGCDLDAPEVQRQCMTNG